MAISGQDKITGGIVMIGSVLVIAVVAGFSKGLGKVLVIFVLGLLLLWIMFNAPLLSKWIGKIPGQSKTVVA